MTTQIQRLFLGCLLLMSWAPSYAYIDPGTGSALIQGVIAAVAAVGQDVDGSHVLERHVTGVGDGEAIGDNTAGGHLG